MLTWYQSTLGWLPLHHYEIALGLCYVNMLRGQTRDYSVHTQLNGTPNLIQKIESFGIGRKMTGKQN